MNSDWELKLQEEFPFMKQTGDEDDNRNIYHRWGFECSGGWYQLLRDCCQQITNRYAESSILFDFIGSGSICFEPGNEDDDDEKKQLRHDIAGIVRYAEERSKHTCEWCGKEGIIRTNLGWVTTLCDSCYDARKKAIEENKKKRAEKENFTDNNE